jgi:hypothetical protein
LPLRPLPRRRTVVRKKPSTAKLRPWRASPLRRRGHHLGVVYAPDEKAAVAAVVADFKISQKQRRCLGTRSSGAQPCFGQHSLLSAVRRISTNSARIYKLYLKRVARLSVRHPPCAGTAELSRTRSLMRGCHGQGRVFAPCFHARAARGGFCLSCPAGRVTEHSSAVSQSRQSNSGQQSQRQIRKRGQAAIWFWTRSAQLRMRVCAMRATPVRVIEFGLWGRTRAWRTSRHPRHQRKNR